jgi:hypothetical protein
MTRLNSCVTSFRKRLVDGKEVNIRIPLLALGTDVFCAHTLGERGSMDLLRDWDQAVEWRQGIIALLYWTPIVRQFPWIIPYAVELPVNVINIFSKKPGLVVSVFQVKKSASYRLPNDQIHNLRVQAAIAIQDPDHLQKKENAGANVFHTILSSSLPA